MSHSNSSAEVATVADPERPDRPTLREPAGIAGLFKAVPFAKFSGVFMFGVIILIFGIWTPDTFLTGTNLRSILSTQAIIAILAIGIIFPLAAGAFDLSAAQNLGFCAVLCGWLMTKHGLPLAAAVLITLCAGAVVGMVNGVLVTVVGIDSFIATLGTTSLLVAGSQIIAGSSYIGPFPDDFGRLTSGEIFSLPRIVGYLAVFAVLAWYVLEHTPLGRRIYATGANRDAARLTGVNTNRMIFGSFVTCGLVAAAAGILLASNLGSVSPAIGPEYLLPAFAGAFLGTTQLKPGRFNIWGTMLAIYLLGTGVQGLQLVGGHVWVTALFNGVALIVAVGAVLMVRRIQEQRATRKAGRASRSARLTTPPGTVEG